jgi:hypothetical protein
MLTRLETLLEEIKNLQRHPNITTNDIILQAIIGKCVESNVFTSQLQNDDSDTFATYLEAYKCLFFLVAPYSYFN